MSLSKVDNQNIKDLELLSRIDKIAPADLFHRRVKNISDFSLDSDSLYVTWDGECAKMSILYQRKRDGRVLIVEVEQEHINDLDTVYRIVGKHINF